MSEQTNDQPTATLPPVAGAAIDSNEGQARDEFDGNDLVATPDGVEPAKPEPKSEDKRIPVGIEKSFARLTRQRTETQEKLNLALQENQRLREALEKPLKPREAYATEAEYLEATVDRTLAQRELPKVEQAAQAAHAAYSETVATEWGEKEAQAKATYSDYDAVVNSVKDPVQPHVRAALLESPAGADIVYHIGRNPEVLRYLNAVSPKDVERWILRAELSLETSRPAAAVQPPPAPAPVPAAPPATPKVSSRSAPVVQNLEQLEGDAYLRAYREIQKNRHR